jgi:hypothetical protein
MGTGPDKPVAIVNDVVPHPPGFLMRLALSV